MIDIKFAELCDEVDYWKQKAEYWKQEYDTVRIKHLQSMNDSIDNGKEQIGMMLSAVLDPDSVINKGHQKILEESVIKD